jgi:chemotaxis protein CheC
VGSLPSQAEDGPGNFATVRMQVLGDVTGETLQIFPDRTARRIAGILTGADDGVVETFGDMERSALVEAGNIIAGAYLNALSDFMGMLLLMSVPTMKLGTGPATAPATAPATGSADEGVALILETHFRMEGENDALEGQFVLVPDPPSIRAILEAINVV